ncbi:hypothetical protein TUM4249_07840 [Shewanella sp. KT0246]|nr:hypothetical protein TUM4249_07840 [Shewanella sp. KT0246]
MPKLARVKPINRAIGEEINGARHIKPTATKSHNLNFEEKPVVMNNHSKYRWLIVATPESLNDN